MDLLRQLDLNQAKTWERRQPPNEEMFAEQDCDPTLLNGWAERDISLWDVSETENRPGLERILIALCRNRTNWDKIGYLVFTNEAVGTAGLTLTPSTGSTGDPSIDQSRTHFEIKNITGKKLCSLVHAVSKSSPRIGIFKKTEMESILYAAYQSSRTRASARVTTRQGPATFTPPSGTQVVNLASEGNHGETFEIAPGGLQGSGTSGKVQTPGNGTT